MTDARHVHEDQWGSIIDRPAAGYVEIRWFDTTAAMSAAAFKEFLSTFADFVAKTGRTRCLVDSTAFAMPREHMDGPWRDANIIPKYEAGGVDKFAFHMPPSMPLIGTEPAPEGPAGFPTGYFGTRADAVAWLSA